MIAPCRPTSGWRAWKFALRAHTTFSTRLSPRMVTSVSWWTAKRGLCPWPTEWARQSFRPSLARDALLRVGGRVRVTRLLVLGVLVSSAACPGPTALTGRGTAEGGGTNTSGLLAFLVQPSNTPAVTFSPTSPRMSRPRSAPILEVGGSAVGRQLPPPAAWPSSIACASISLAPATRWSPRRRGFGARQAICSPSSREPGPPG